MSTRDFDIIVIGAGIAGTSVAAHLAEHRRVLVLERESQPGYHSTGRSAALFSETYGSEPVRALSRASRELFYNPPAGFAEPPLVKRRGSLHVATTAQLPVLDAFAALPDIAAASKRLSTAEALAICSILREDQVAGAVFEPEAADVDVNSLHQAYLRLLRRRNGQLLTDHPLVSLQRQDGKWIATSGDEQFAAPILVNASGAWADEVARMGGVAPIGLQPLRRTALLVDPPSGVTITDWPIVIDIDEQFYFKPDAGQLLLSPADETPSAPCDAQPEELDVAIAADRVMTATTLDIRRIKHSWAGLRSFVADRTPVAGFDPDAEGFFWLAGQGGYGIQTAPALSRTASALVLGQAVPADILNAGLDPADLSPARLTRPTA